MATHYCDECVHFDFEPMDFEKPCKKGHAPKFFLPKNDDYGSIDWGWKRNCDDFTQTPVTALNAPGVS